MKFRHPVALTCDQLVSEHPGRGWYTITDGTLDLANSVPEDGTESAYFVPVKTTAPLPVAAPAPVDASNPDGAVIGAPTQKTGTGVVAYITDEPTIKLIDAYNNSVRRPMTPHAELHSSDYAGITPQATLGVQVSGMIVPVDGGSDNGSSDAQSNDASDMGAITIGLGRQPSVWKGFLMIGVGVILAFGVLWSFGVSPSISGIKETVAAAKGGYGGYNQPSAPSYRNVLPPSYPNNQWQNHDQQQPGSYPQPGQPYPAPTPANAWSPTGQDNPYAQKPASQQNPTAPAPWNPSAESSE
jgi:hypothetical protein